MLAFGIIGFILRELKFPMAPLVLGIVLGDLLDLNLRRGLQLSNGDLAPFFTRPISAVICIIIVLTLVFSVPAVSRIVRGLFRGAGGQSPQQG